MKNTYRILSVVMSVILCFGLLAACGNTTADPTQKPTETQPVETTLPAGTEPFIAPPDALGKIVSADSTLITWNTYATTDETIDFMGINVKELGEPGAEMSLFYLEEEVTYYIVSEGKLNPATVEDLVAGSIVGITTLEEGVQEVYIIFVPVEDDGSDEYEDVVDEIVEDTVPPTTAAEPTVPDDGAVVTEPTDEVSEVPTEDMPVQETPSLEEIPEDTEPAEEETPKDTEPVEEETPKDTEPAEELIPGDTEPVEE